MLQSMKSEYNLSFSLKIYLLIEIIFDFVYGLRDTKKNTVVTSLSKSEIPHTIETGEASGSGSGRCLVFPCGDNGWFCCCVI